MGNLSYTGKCGDDLTWEFCGGVLTISGTGDMYDWGWDDGPAPWDSYRDIISSIVINDGVTSIGAWAFSYCTYMESADIPNSVTRIAYWAFHECTNLKSIDIPEGVTRIEARTFTNCKNLRSIKLPSNLTFIGNYAIAGCINLKSIDLPDSVAIMDYYAFFDTGLTTIKIPSSMTHIGNHSFEGSDLVYVVLPDSVTEIEIYAFSYCTDLTRIDIPSSVMYIGSRAFDHCIALTDVYYSGTEEEWKNISIDSNNESLTNATIHYNSSMPIPTPKPEYTINNIQISDEIVSVNVTRSVGQNVKVIVASYTDDGTLVGVTFRDINDTGTVDVKLRSEGADHVSAFIWDNFSDMTPASDKAVKNL